MIETERLKIGTWFMDYNDFNEEMRSYEKRFEEQMRASELVNNRVFYTWKLYRDGIEFRNSNGQGNKEKLNE